MSTKPSPTIHKSNNRPQSLPKNLDVPTLGDHLFAGLDQRLSATLLDLLAFIILYLIAGVLLSVATRLTGLQIPLSPWGDLLAELYLPALAYCIIALRLFSATAGKRVLGIQVLRSDGSKIGWTRSFLREVIRLSPLLPLAAIMTAFRKDNRGLHDILADTVVVHAAPGIPAARIE